MNFNPVSGIIDSATGLVSALKTWFTTDNEREQNANKAIELVNALQTKLIEAKQGINNLIAQAMLADASSPRLFNSGWRPAMGWVAAFGLLYSFILQPIAVVWLPKLPPLPSGELKWLVMLLLGMSGWRSFDKKNGVARN
jgi:hypothetical protein